MTPQRVRLLGGILLGLLALALVLEAVFAPTRTPLAPMALDGGPVVTGVEPTEGRAGGGGPLVVIGENFQVDDVVVVGGRRVEDDLEIEPNRITLRRTPGGRAGTTVEVAVERTDDLGDPIGRGVLPDAYSYEGLSRRGVVLIGFFLGCFALAGGPLFIVLGGVTLLGLFLESQASGVAGMGFFRSAVPGAPGEAGFGASLLVSWLNKTTDSPLFIAIPLFTFAGTLMAESKTPERLVNLSRALIGWLPGGFALVTLVACSLFTAFTGASGITIIALGGLLYPILRREGYDDRYSLGLLTTCGSLGLLFPPSLPVIIYGIIAKVDIDRLFMAALIPGFFLLALLGLYSMRVAVRERVPRHRFSRGELALRVRQAFWELPLPVLVIGGIYGGFITAAEAAAVTAFYAVVVQVFVYRDVKVRDLPHIVRLSMVLVGAILLILGMALALIDWLTLVEVPQQILALMKEHIHSRVTFLLTLNVFLLIVGCIMEGYSATLVVVPLVAPIALEYGIDPYHLGVIFLLNLEIAYSMPPVGFNLFLSAMRFGRPVTQLYRAALDFIAVMVVALLVVTYVPSLSLMLFERPALEIAGPRDGALTAVVTHGGVAMPEARDRLAAAETELAQVEERLGLRYDDLASRAQELEDDRGAAKELAAVREQQARFGEVPARVAAARKLVLELEKLAAGVVWSSPDQPKLVVRGLTFPLDRLESGVARVMATTTGDRGHLAHDEVDVSEVETGAAPAG